MTSVNQQTDGYATDTRQAMPPVDELRVALVGVAEAAIHLHEAWPRLVHLERKDALLGLEHDVVRVLTKVGGLGHAVHAVQAARRSSNGNGNGNGSAVLGGRLERDLMRVERLAAARDRDAAGLLLHQAALLRQAAAADRDEAALMLHQVALERVALRTDDLTRALERRHGLSALEREVERAKRGDGRLVVGFMDVDGLKRVNDTRGHAAGDELLRQVVAALKSSLRPYDVVVRYGGDEFVYAMAGVTLAGARRRFAAMEHTLREATGGQTVSVGFAELAPDDALATAIARADADLYASRGHGVQAG